MGNTKSIQTTKSKQLTKIDRTRVSFEWRIQEFDLFMQLFKPDECINSAIAFSPEDLQARWLLGVVPNGEDEKSKGSSSVYVFLASDKAELKEKKLRALVHIYLISKEGGKKQKETLTHKAHDFEPKPSDMEILGFGIRGVSHERVKKALRSDGSLVLGCDIDFTP